MQNFIWPALLTVGAGISVFVQQVLNANLRAELNSAAWSGFMSNPRCRLYGVSRGRPPRSRTVAKYHCTAAVVGLERWHIRRDLYRALNCHDPETGGCCLHRYLGDR